MDKIIRYWNQNRIKIILIIAIIVFVFILIQVTNNLIKEKKQEQQMISNIDKSVPIKSVITGETVPIGQTNDNIKCIENFVNYCNNREFEKAYNLLSENCQNEYENSVNTFIKNYCENIFNKSRTYKLELMYYIDGSYTYTIKYYEDNLLATGKDNQKNNLEDYITVVKQNGVDKLNINGLINKKEIGKSVKSNDVEVIVKTKRIYKNYEVYDVTIRNYTKNTILIGSNYKEICIVDDNNAEYTPALDKILSENLSIKSGYEKNISIRFDKIYSAYRNTKSIKFKNIILEGEKYIQNPNNNTQNIQISIDIK